MVWRKNLDNQTLQNLNKMISNTVKFSNTYSKADNPQQVQMWLVLLEIYKMQEQMIERIDALEQHVLGTSTAKKKNPVLKDLENY